MSKSFTYIVEHLDPELEAWSALEYKSIATESKTIGARFLLSSVPDNFKLPEELKDVPGLEVEHKGVEELFKDRKSEVCLLDPKAEKELSPGDAETFSVFLFGGILGDDPPRDRTSELRAKGFQGRRLGPVQMTTDTAVRVTRLVIQGGLADAEGKDQGPMELEKIPYTDHPEIKVSQHESTEMPFRYVRDARTGGPIMPEGMLELIKRDSEKGLGDLL